MRKTMKFGQRLPLIKRDFVPCDGGSHEPHSCEHLNPKQVTVFVWMALPDGRMSDLKSFPITNGDQTSIVHPFSEWLDRQYFSDEGWINTR